MPCFKEDSHLQQRDDVDSCQAVGRSSDCYVAIYLSSSTDY